MLLVRASKTRQGDGRFVGSRGSRVGHGETPPRADRQPPAKKCRHGPLKRRSLPDSPRRWVIHGASSVPGRASSKSPGAASPSMPAAGSGDGFPWPRPTPPPRVSLAEEGVGDEVHRHGKAGNALPEPADVRPRGLPAPLGRPGRPPLEAQPTTSSARSSTRSGRGATSPQPYAGPGSPRRPSTSGGASGGSRTLPPRLAQFERAEAEAEVSILASIRH